MRILKEDGEEAKKNELGRVVCKLPLPPGTMSTLYKGNERFIKTYFQSFSGYYDTCDAGIIGKSLSEELTQYMTIDCSLIYQFNTWKLQAQNMGRTNYAHTMFSPCFERVVFMYVYCLVYLLPRL